MSFKDLQEQKLHILYFLPEELRIPLMITDTDMKNHEAKRKCHSDV